MNPMPKNGKASGQRAHRGRGKGRNGGGRKEEDPDYRGPIKRKLHVPNTCQFVRQMGTIH